MNMKNFKYFLIPAAIVILTGCSGFFETSSVSTMDASEVFGSSIRTEQAIQGVYELFGENNSYRNRIACGYIGFNTDIERSTKSASSSAPDDELMTYAIKTSHKSVSSTNGSDIWAYLNSAIERTNNIIEGIETYSCYNDAEAEDYLKMRYYLGEAYFLRSFAYLEMVKIWGDVPARFVSLSADPEGLKAMKTDRNVIYEQLRVDLKKAADYMPWSAQIPVAAAANNVGRPSKAAALALLARADLMYAGKAVRPEQLVVGGTSAYSVRYNIEDATKRQEVYKEAMDACAEIIKSGEKSLAEDFATPFKQICSDQKNYSAMEHIWAIPFLNGARGQVLNYNAPKLPSASTTAGPTSVAGHLPGYGNGGSSNGHITINPWLLYQFDKTDKRRDVTMVPFQWYYDNGNSAVKNDTARIIAFLGKDSLESCLYQKANAIDAIYCGKYRYEWMATGRELVGTDDGVDFPIVRYADVLMMFAEASIGGISGDAPTNDTGLNPLDEYNKVRKRAGLADIPALSMEEIQLERAKEFVGEYIRKWDLMRWGILKEQVVAATDFCRNIARPSGRTGTEIGDTLYYKYAYDNTLKAYVIDSMYGFCLGEKSCPPYYKSANGWLKKNLFYSDSKDWLLDASNYVVYADEEQLESRQYWPIWGVNVKASPETLWNDYGYSNE